ncbi:3TM-type holin [Emcibacter sp.]|uniref:3TM-type holin n=1 Tax=Emcibacter sp. TaxID=1979954 RepID=UPI002AA9192F|nr:3TM-type holin [Emcibacter sp.]
MSIWGGVKKIIGGAAPLVGTLVGGPFGTIAGSMISKALGEDANVDMNDPAAVQMALQNDPGAVLRLKQLELENQTTLQMAAIQAETARQAEVNKTMRNEQNSDDPYVRRWRPTLGYAVAITWAVQMMAASAAIVWAVIEHPEQAMQIINSIGVAVSNTSVLWGTALSVLGVSVVQRSRDKAVKAGQSPVTMMEGLAQIIRGKKSDG